MKDWTLPLGKLKAIPTYLSPFIFLFFGLQLQAQTRTLRIGVATQSAVKVEAVEKAFQSRFPEAEIEIFAYKAKSGIAEQPVGEEWGLRGARNRIESAKTLAGEQALDYWVSMENFIEPTANPEVWRDVAQIVIIDIKAAQEMSQLSTAVTFSKTFADAARLADLSHNDVSGYAVTSGTVISSYYQQHKNINLPSDDWHRHSDFGGVSRSILLERTLSAALVSVSRCNLASH